MSINYQCEFCSLKQMDKPILPGHMQDINTEGLHNHLIYNGAFFYVKPDVSPVIENHLLIIPKSHVFCMKLLPEECKEEFDEVCQKIIDFYSTMGKGYFFFEHGCCSDREPGSACIHHAHLHAVPISKEQEKIIVMEVLNYLGIIFADSKQLEGKTYLYAKTERFGPKYWEDSVQRSQFFRIVVAKVIGDPNRARWQNCLVDDDERKKSVEWLKKFNDFKL